MAPGLDCGQPGAEKTARAYNAHRENVMVAKIISKVKEALAVIVTVTTLLSGIVAVTWCKFAVPEVDSMIDKKQSPVVEELKKLNSSVRFQTYIQMGTRPQCEYDSLLKDWNRLKSGGTE